MTNKDKLKVIIAGGRDFTDVQFGLNEFLIFSNEITQEIGLVEPFARVISGGARGADLVGERIASMCHLPVDRFIPNWDTLGKRAGFVRNAEMADHADALLAFWDNKSKGTAHMIKIARQKGLIVKVVMYG